jgi:predicted RNA-binding protein YlqC (UPF0109 family)
LTVKILFDIVYIKQYWWIRRFFYNDQMFPRVSTGCVLTTDIFFRTSMTDQQFVEMLVKPIVNSPDKVSTTRIVDERGVLITLKVDPTDMGYVIGRQGQTARAIRILLKAFGSKLNARVNLKIEEPEGGRGPRPGAMPDTSAVDDLGI